MLAILAIHVVGRVGAFCSPYQADSYAYAAFAYRMAHGEVLYRDLSVDKPPGLLWLEMPVYWYGPPARWPLIPLETVGMLLGYWAVYRLARELYGRSIGLGLAVVAALAINFFLLCDYTIEGFCLAESFMVFPMALAVLHYRRGCLSGRDRSFVIAGIYLGLTLLLKQTVAALLVAVAVHRTLFELCVHRRARAWFNQGALLFAGWAGVLIAAAVALYCEGTLAVAIHSMTVRATKLLHKATAWPGGWRDVLVVWTPLAWCALGLAGWAVHRLRRPHPAKPAGPSAEDISLLVLWAICECALLVYLPRRGAHYYAISFLPVVLLSGVFWSLLKLEYQRAGPRLGRALVGAALIWSAAYVRLAIDVLVPVSVARYRLYDFASDRAVFADFLTLDNIIIE